MAQLLTELFVEFYPWLYSGALIVTLRKTLAAAMVTRSVSEELRRESAPTSLTLRVTIDAVFRSTGFASSGPLSSCPHGTLRLSMPNAETN